MKEFLLFLLFLCTGKAASELQKIRIAIEHGACK